MIMPFVRLLAIYALVGAAIFAILNRDALIAYFSVPASEMTAAATPLPAPTPAPSPAPAPGVALQPQAPVIPLPTQRPRPRFGSEITPQYFGQNAASNAAPSPRPRGGNLVLRWTKAREMFNQGNIAEASTLYEALTASFPDNADLHGEAGNLYYNLGQFAKAATHYFAVGEISVRSGNRAMAASMHSVLQRIAPNKATELQAIITAAR